jgi:hypothetical protein
MHPYAVLQKPVDPEQLTATVRRAGLDYLGRHQPGLHE